MKLQEIAKAKWKLDDFDAGWVSALEMVRDACSESSGLNGIPIKIISRDQIEIMISEALC